MAGGVGKMSRMMKTTATEKGRGDSGSEMWNQVLLGTGGVKEQWWWPISSPLPLVTSFAPTPYPSPWSISLFLVTPIPDLPLTTALPLRLHSLQFLTPSLGSLEGLCVAIQGLRKRRHGPHHAAQLPGLNLASESLQEAVRVPADLLDPQVPPQGPLLLQGGTPGHQGCGHGLRVPSPRAGPGHIAKAPEAAPPRSSWVLCPGPSPGWLRPSVPTSLLRPLGSALTQFFLLGPGSLSEEPLLLLLPLPAVTGALSPWGSAGSLCLMLLLVLLGMFLGQAI